MANKRIRETSLPQRYRDGQVLRAEDLNQIVKYIVYGVNANKKDIDQILTGRHNSLVFYNTDYNAPPIDKGDEGDYSFMFFNDETSTEDRLVMYRKANGEWVELYEVNLFDVFMRLDEYEQEVQGLKEISNTFKRPVRAMTTDYNISGLLTIDEVKLRNGDRVLVLGQGDNSGIYNASNGTWNKIGPVNKLDLYSVNEGEVNGGNIVKIVDNNGNYEVVKYSDVPRWEIIG